MKFMVTVVLKKGFHAISVPQVFTTVLPRFCSQLLTVTRWTTIETAHQESLPGITLGARSRIGFQGIFGIL